MSTDQVVLKSDESYVYARHQAFALLMFGIAALIAAGLYVFLDPQTTEAKWFWVFAGPLLGLLVMFRAQDQWDGTTETVPGPYLGVFIGAVAGCFVLSMTIQQSWIVPASLLVVAILLGFLAWFEQNGLGMSAAIVVAILTGVTSAASLSADASLITAIFGGFLLLGGLSLASKPEVDAQHQVSPQLRLLDLTAEADSTATVDSVDSPRLELALEA